MNTSRYIKAIAGEGNYSVTSPITQWDYGYVLQIEGIELPTTYAQANGLSSHAEGTSTIAQRKSQLVIGECNTPDTGGNNNTTKGDYIFIAGNGSNVSQRSNAMTLDWNGNEKLSGGLTLGMGTNDETSLSASELKALKGLLDNLEFDA